MTDSYTVSFVIHGNDLDPSDVLDNVTDFIAPELAARLECFYDPDSISVEG